MGDVSFTAQTRFRNNMRLQLGQHKPLLASRTLERDVAGVEKDKLENLISNAKTKKKTARNTDVEYDTTGWDGIWVAKPDADYLATLVDNDDKLMTGVDIEGGEVMKHGSAIARAWDDAWLGGFFGDMITGKSGTVLNPFPSGNVVPVNLKAAGVTPAVGGMNVAKIKRARRILAQNFVDMQQDWYLAITAQGVEDLMQEVEVTSSDFEKLKGRMSEDGKHLIGMLGFEFVEIELGNPMLDNAALSLTDDGNAYRKLPFWTKDGMVMAVWERLFASVDPLPGKHHSHQVYSRTTVTSSRTDQNRCGYILVDE